MGTVNINGSNYTVYGSLAACDAYVNGGIGTGYDDYNALTDDDDRRGRLLLTATRYLDRQAWTSAYATFAARDAVDAFQAAAYELAALFSADADAQAQGDQASNIASLSAGSASIEFVAPTSVEAGTATKLPQVVQDLVGAYLAAPAGAVISVVPIASGGSSDSYFDACDRVTRTEPF